MAQWHMHRCACSCNWHKLEYYLGLKMQYLWNIDIPGNADWSSLGLEFVWGIQYMAQSTVDFPIGGHVNVLSDYKETEPENFLF